MATFMNRVIFKVKRMLLNKKDPSYYVTKAKEHEEQGNNDKALQLLLKGNRFYPNNLAIHYSLATYYSKSKENTKANNHYYFIFNSKNKKQKSDSFYIDYFKSLKKAKKSKEAITVLEDGLQLHKKSRKIKLALIKEYRKKKRFEDALKLVLQYIVENETKVTVEQYLLFAQIYNANRQFNQAEYLLKKALQIDESNLPLLEEHLKTAIYRYDWKQAAKRIEKILDLDNLAEEKRFDLLMKKAMTLQIEGNKEEADELYDKLFSEYANLIANDEAGNRKIILFDNGDSRIEFYKKLKKVDQLVVSFDSLHMDWNEPAFGYVLLKKQDVDIIAVRKRVKSTYQQDLTQEEFTNSVSKITEKYADTVAYGHSLGGYLSLYYAANINCRILSLAPRLSIHPIYGRNTVHNNDTFLHNVNFNYNDEIAPIIVYDPNDRTDNKYVEEEILNKFPNAILIKMYYGGHGIARHLLRMGVLKDYILTVIAGEVPQYDRSIKHKSGNYCRLLGRKCLNRNKIGWADDLSKQAYELIPNDKYAAKLRVDVLLRLERFAEAGEIAIKSARKAPNNVVKQLTLVDYYLQTSQLIKAQHKLDKLLRKFPNNNNVKRKAVQLDDAFAKFVNEEVE